MNSGEHGGFIDLHCHVLPMVDDGPSKWDEAMDMFRQASESGTSTIIATPHGDSRGRWEKIESLEQICLELNKALKQEQIPLNLLLGMEVPLELNTVERVKNRTALTLNGSAYILVELPFLQLPLYWEEALFQMQMGGLKPIIAHPERQAQLSKNPNLMAGVVGRGVLGQLTAGSLVGEFGPDTKKSAEILLRRGLVHVIASDAHRARQARSTDIRPGLKAAIKIVGQEQADNMTSGLPFEISRPSPKPA